MRRRKGMLEDLNYWPSVADFMLALFMVALIMGLTNIVLLYSQQENERNEGQNLLVCKQEREGYKNAAESCQKEKHESCVKRLNDLKGKIQQCAKQLEEFESQLNICGKTSACQNNTTNLADSTLKITDGQQRSRSETTLPQAQSSPENTEPDQSKENKNTSQYFNQELQKTPSQPANLQQCEESIGKLITIDASCTTSLNSATAKQQQCLAVLGSCLTNLNQQLGSLGDSSRPAIQMTSAEGFTFDPNKADTSKFRVKLRDKFQGWLKEYNLDKNEKKYHTLEIIGHTDPSPISSSANSGNIDSQLALLDTPDKVVQGSMKSGSNADLGLWRAVAVSQEWYKWISETRTFTPQEQQNLRDIEVRCYSAAYGVPNDSEEGSKCKRKHLDDPKACDRRIEIRFTQVRTGVKGVCKLQ